MTGWLVYILSEGDHRLNQAQDWVAGRSHVLSLLGAALGERLTDDRLALVWTC